MTHEEHVRKHFGMHRALSELVADFQAHNKNPNTKLMSVCTVLELMDWSYQQAMVSPTHKPEEHES